MSLLNTYFEDTLLERYQIERIAKLATQVELAEKASDQLLQFFITGEATYLDVLSANQSQQRLQRSLLSARLDLILIRVGLYLALAGDFDTRPDAALSLPADLPQVPSDRFSAERNTDPIGNSSPELASEISRELSDLPAPPTDRSPMLQPAKEIDINE